MDAKKIDEDPSAFIDQDSIQEEDRRGNPDLSKHNPGVSQNQQAQNYQMYFHPMHQQMMMMNMMNGGVPMMYHPSMNIAPPGYFPVNNDPMIAIEHQRQVLQAELREIESQKERIREVENENMVNTKYRKTEDILNKYNKDYELDESQMAYSKGMNHKPKTQEEILESIQKLDELLDRKKANNPIPFIQTYTPNRQKHQQVISKHNNNSNNDGSEFVRDSLEWDGNSNQQNVNNDGSYDSLAEGNNDQEEKDGYLKQKKRKVQQKLSQQENKQMERNLNVKKNQSSNLVVESEHGVVKVNNKVNLQDLFS